MLLLSPQHAIPVSSELFMLVKLTTDVFSFRTLKLPCMQTWMVQEKLRESRYQIPWHTESSNNTSHPVPTDAPVGKVLVTTV